MTPISVERSVWIAAPRERVWRAITEPEELGAWFLPRELGAQMARDEAGKLSVLMGPMTMDMALLEALDPPRQVTTRGLPDRLLATTYSLADENDGTRVTVVMTGFEALPAEAVTERLEPSGRAWEKALQNLKAYVEGSTLPYPQGFVAALLGYRRETPRRLMVERSIWINAPRERVWQALTDPAQVEQWFSPGTSWTMTAFEVGGRFFVYDAEHQAELYTQVIEVLDPPRRYATRSAPTPPEQPHLSEWTLSEEAGGTRLTISYSGYELDPADGREAAMEQTAFGFGLMLANVRAVVEGLPLPMPGGF
jgi:uncharacterized protein YndB with AHSA1/START domain